MDPEALAIQADESLETTLDRTRHLLARSRMTLNEVTRRLNKRDHEHESSSQSGNSLE